MYGTTNLLMLHMYSTTNLLMLHMYGTTNLLMLHMYGTTNLLMLHMYGTKVKIIMKFKIFFIHSTILFGKIIFRFSDAFNCYMRINVHIMSTNLLMLQFINYDSH